MSNKWKWIDGSGFTPTHPSPDQLLKDWHEQQAQYDEWLDSREYDAAIKRLQDQIDHEQGLNKNWLDEWL